MFYKFMSRVGNTGAEVCEAIFTHLEHGFHWLSRKWLLTKAQICRLRGHRGTLDCGAVYCLRCKRFISLRSR